MTLKDIYNKISLMRIRKEFENMPEERIMAAAKMSEAFGHPARIKIYRHIMKSNSERIPVMNKDLVAAFEYSQATISQHLNKLIIAGFVKTEKKGTATYYYANIGNVGKYIDMIKEFK